MGQLCPIILKPMNYYSEFKNYAKLHIGLHSCSLQGITPTVIEERQMNVTQMDVFSRLMKDRIIFLGVPIDDYVANVIQAQLLFMESVDPKREISMYINSPGGSVTAGLGIYDTMQYISPEVATICTGMAASMSAVLLAAGAESKRSCLAHSRVMIHQTSGGMSGQFSDMEITYKLFLELQNEMYAILSKHTGQSISKIHKDCDRDHWMKAHEAKSYGIVDEILTK